MKLLVAIYVLLSFGTYVTGLTPWGKKSIASDQADTINEIAKELEVSAESFPTTQGVIQEIKKIDAVELNKLNEEVAKLSKIKVAQLCTGPQYERDYKFPCPSGWRQISDGQCWGRKYRGPCESMVFMNKWSKEEKMEFEHRCCVFWQRKVYHLQPVSRIIPPSMLTHLTVAEKKKLNEKFKLRDVMLHGPVDPKNGTIIPP